MNERDFHKMISPLGRRVSNILTRGTVTRVNSAKKMQTLQVKLLAGEVADDIEHFEPYGFTSCPRQDAESLMCSIDGDKSHSIVLVVGDRRFRLTALEEGEVALHDDQGQFVHIKRDSVHIKSNTEIVLDAPSVRCTGDMQAAGDVMDQGGTKSMSGMRAVFDTHTHGENDGGSNTDTPNTPM